MTSLLRPKPFRFHHDFETFSEVDVTKVGAPRYARHESTEPLMLAYAFDDLTDDDDDLSDEDVDGDDDDDVDDIL